MADLCRDARCAAFAQPAYFASAASHLPRHDKSHLLNVPNPQPRPYRILPPMTSSNQQISNVIARPDSRSAAPGYRSSPLALSNITHVSRTPLNVEDALVPSPKCANREPLDPPGRSRRHRQKYQLEPVAYPLGKLEHSGYGSRLPATRFTHPGFRTRTAAKRSSLIVAV